MRRLKDPACFAWKPDTIVAISSFVLARCSAAGLWSAARPAAFTSAASADFALTGEVVFEPVGGLADGRFGYRRLSPRPAGAPLESIDPTRQSS